MKPGTFEKGKSGNPSGRPKLPPEIKEMARAAAPDAFQRVIALSRSDDERVALQAAQTILDRAYGKAAQAVTGENGEGAVLMQIITGVPRE